MIEKREVKRKKKEIELYKDIEERKKERKKERKRALLSL